MLAGLASVSGADTAKTTSPRRVEISVTANGFEPEKVHVTHLGSDDNHFHHAAGTRSGVTFDYLYHCNDNADVIVEACSSAVDHSHITVKLTGNATGGTAMTGINSKGSWTVRDIDIVKPRVGGTSMFDFSATVNGASYVFSLDTTLDRVRYEPAGVLPLSGKIDFVISANRTRADNQRDFTGVASLVFAGSNTAQLTIDNTKHYAIDLATGVATKQ